MATTSFHGFYNANVRRVRDVKDVKARASKRIKDKRKSNREDNLNLLRQVEYIPEAKKSKKSEQKEKLLQLQIYKQEKLKRMEEQKKTRKPPFYNLVVTRHTGATPFRTKHPGITSPVTRSRTANRKKLFEFKANLDPDKPKEPTVLNKRTATSKQLGKNTVNIKPSSSKTAQEKIDLKSPPKAVAKRKGKVVSTKNVTNASEERLLPKNNTTGKKYVEKENVKKVASSSTKRVSRRNITTRKNSPVNEENLEKLNSSENKIPDIDDLLAERLAEQVIIMSPRENTRITRRLTRRYPNPSAGYELVSDLKSQNKENEMKNNNQEEDENKKSELESGTVGPEELRNKLNEETARLSSISDLWSQINTDESIPGDVKDEILAVVGQTRLLISDKFQQFKSLIDNAQCKQDETSAIKIKNDDLLGFWEMMYIVVEQLNKKYQNLEDLKNNDWRSCGKVAVVGKSKKKRTKKKKSSKPKSSKFRDFLKKKIEGNDNNMFEETDNCLIEGEAHVPDTCI